MSTSPCVSLSTRRHNAHRPYHEVGPESDRHRRDVFKGHKYYRACVDFCENWDQAAFDPDYRSLPLNYFVPMVERVLAREPFWWVNTEIITCWLRSYQLAADLS